jgi:hypothetical protein
LPTLFGKLQQLGFTEPQLREAAMAVLQEEEWGRPEAEATAPATQEPAPAEATAPAGNVP